MNWRQRLRGLFGSRQGLCALLFLGCLAFGGYTLLAGSVERATACAGYLPPQVETLAKTDPDLPHRPRRAAGLREGVGGETPEPLLERAADFTAKAEKTAEEALQDQKLFIGLYGAAQRALGRSYVEDPADPAYGVARMEDGGLTFVGTERAEPEDQAADLKRFQLLLAEEDIPLLYLQAPAKLEPGAEGLPRGVEDTTNESMDALLAALQEAGVESIDFREALRQTGEPWGTLFYTTDHHWNQRGAFAAFRTLAKRLEGYRPQEPAPGDKVPHPFKIDRRLTDPASYEVTTLEGFFLGSQGKRVGTGYAGTDDFELWTPAFPTLLRYNAPAAGVDRYGSLEQTVLFPERVEELDYYDATPYTYYAGGDYPISWITNYYNPDGPRVVLIRDSYACALTPYLALACSQVVTIDPRYFSGDVMTYVRWARPDVVMVMFSGGLVRSQAGMRFLRQPAAPGKGTDLMWEDTLRGTGLAGEDGT